MQKLWHKLFESDAQTITWWAMSIRAIIIFIVAIILIRLGGKRMFGKHSTFDIILGVILGAVLGKAIAGSAKFFPTIIASFTLVAMHRIFAHLTLNNQRMGWLIKGKTDVLVKDGQPIESALKKNNVSNEDLLESMRTEGALTDIKKVKLAFLERNGKISIIPVDDK